MSRKAQHQILSRRLAQRRDTEKQPSYISILYGTAGVVKMKPTGRTASILALSLLALSILGGCTVVDQYGSRAIEYNQQTGNASNSLILLNILRAAYREPMQFTDVTTVTGTALAQGGLGANIPVWIGGAGLTSPNLLNLNPSATVSGGPNFSIANLNSQEFYQGMQSSIDSQVIDTYVSSGVSLNLLLPLLISEIDLDEDNKVRILRNTGSTEESYEDFRRVIAELVYKGFYIETKPSSEDAGPSLTREEASDPRLLAALVQAGDASSLTLKEKNGSSQFVLSRLGKKPSFCFRQQRRRYEDIDYIELPKEKGIQTISLKFPGVRVLTVRMRPCGTAGKEYVNAKFTLRSVEQIFLYLGEIVRTELSLGGEPNPLVVNPKDIDPKNPVPAYLFRVEQRMPRNGEISANFHGNIFTVTADPTGTDASSQVVAILTDLLALQSSAKNLPAPNVIAVTP